ncbi:seminal metalloprotease 1 [Bombyx mori]|uniref:Metalloendopeptidase n=1 Tax=Bombyx mori TaxID=7091 RepID=A0A8R2DLI3_BOMMO|nr:seminal metalloprotease 1 [Bombyx mori]
MSLKWSLGIIPYYVDPESYDKIIENRIRLAMKTIEKSSCLIFKRLNSKPADKNLSWLHFTNPQKERDCTHQLQVGEYKEVIVTLGFECMLHTNIMHSLLHALGFNDEVTHPHRDKYIRILWENMQPKYRPLFLMQTANEPNRPVVEYDPQSVMHFHDRAFSVNGEATIAPLIPGMIIRSGDKLSQLDKMKLKLYFTHECNKRTVEELIDACRDILLENAVAGRQQDKNNSTYNRATDEDDTEKDSGKYESEQADESDYTNRGDQYADNISTKVKGDIQSKEGNSYLTQKFINKSLKKEGIK